MNKLLASAAMIALSFAACSMETEGTAEQDTANVGTVSMPLTQTTNGITFDIDGTLTFTNVATGSIVTTQDLEAFTGSTSEPVRLNVGTYDVTLSGWSTYARYMSLPPVEVSAISRIISPLTVRVVIVGGDSHSIAFDFVIDGQIISFNLCRTANLLCPSQDADNDTIPNGVECPGELVNSDNDANPDCDDADSDNDGLNDGLESPGGRMNACIPSLNAASCVQPDGSVSVTTNICIGSLDGGVCADAGTN